MPNMFLDEFIAVSREEIVRGCRIDSRHAPLVLIIRRPDDLETCGAYLKNAGFRVIEAFSAQDGFDQAVAIKPDFIVLGFEVNGDMIARLRGADVSRPVPIIALAKRVVLGRSGQSCNEARHDHLTRRWESMTRSS